MERYVDACIAELRHGRATELRPATSVFFGGGTPSRLPADELCRRPGGRARTRRGRGDGRVQPRGRHPATVHRLPGRPGSPGCPSASSPRPSTCWLTLGRRHEPDTVPRAAGVGAGCRLRIVERRPHLRRSRARPTPTGTARWPTCSRLPRRPARERLRPYRRTGHAAGRRSATAIPTTTCRPPATSAPTRCWRPPATGGRRCPTGACRATAAPTTSSTGAKATTEGIGSAAHSHRGRDAGGGMSATPSATWRRDRGRSSPDGRPGGADRGSTSLRVPGARAPHAGGVPEAALPSARTGGVGGTPRRSGGAERRRGRLLANAVTTTCGGGDGPGRERAREAPITWPRCRPGFEARSPPSDADAKRANFVPSELDKPRPATHGEGRLPLQAAGLIFQSAEIYGGFGRPTTTGPSA